MHLQIHESLLSLFAVVLGLLLLSAALRRIHQPYVVAYLAAGVLLGPHVLGVIHEPVVIEVLGAVGVDMLLFFIGMEIAPARLIRHWKIAVLGTLLQIALSTACVLGLGWLLDWPVARSILVGFVLSLSSTAVILRILEERGEIRSRVGRDVLMILLAQDMALIPMLMLLGAMGGEGPSGATLFRQITGAVLFVALVVWMASRRTVHIPLVRWIREDRELQVFGGLALWLGLALASGLLELSTALGSFVAGMLVGAARETDWVHESLHSFRVVFVALFFVSVGMSLDLPFVSRSATLVGGLTLLVLVMNTAINTAIFRLFRHSWRDALYAGALLAQIGEFSFVLASVGLRSGIISSYGYNLTLSLITVSLIVSPLWILALCGRRWRAGGAAT